MISDPTKTTQFEGIQGVPKQEFSPFHLPSLCSYPLSLIAGNTFRRQVSLLNRPAILGLYSGNRENPKEGGNGKKQQYLLPTLCRRATHKRQSSEIMECDV